MGDTLKWIFIMVIALLIVSFIIEPSSLDKAKNSVNGLNSLLSTIDKPSNCTIGNPKYPLLIKEGETGASLVGPQLKNIVSNDWRIEGDIRTCYTGRYKGQFPDWLYCDDMIVSKWETSSSGAIKYRWYTAVSAEFKPKIEAFIQYYEFENFACENGKKVTVDKEKTNYYVHVSRDGTEIKIEY